MKVCRVCGDNQPASEYHKDAKKVDGRRNICKACKCEQDRWDKISRRYSLSREAFYELLDAQNGRCAACHQPLEKGMAVGDHCHDTGVVRGLLDRECNIALGLLGDGRDNTRILGLLRYAEHHAEHDPDD